MTNLEYRSNRGRAIHRLLLAICGIFLLVANISTAQPLDTLLADLGNASRESLSLTEYLEVLEDPSTLLTLDDILKPEMLSRFKGNQRPGMALNFGYSRSAIWLRLPLRNRGAAPLNLMLELSKPPLGSVQLHQPTSGGRFLSIATGMNEPFATRPYPNRNFVFPLTLPAESEQVVYMRIRSTNSTSIPLKLWNVNAFRQYEKSDYSIQSWYFGMAMAMIGFNLLLYFGLRDVIYLLYVGFAFTLAMSIASLNGLSKEFLWPEASLWAEISTTFGYSVALAALIAFMRRMLDTKRVVPKIDPALKAMAFCLLASTIGFVFSFSTFLRLAPVLYVVACAFILGTSLLCAYRHQESAMFFALAFCVPVVCTVATALQNSGFLQVNYFTTNAVQIGSTVEMMLLAFALANRIRILMRREESEKARASAEAAANQAKSIFLSNMSHELRSPLNVILGFSRLLIREPGLASAAKKDLEVVVRSGEHLFGLINQILDISKIEAGRTTLEESNFDLHRLCLEIDEMFRLIAQQKQLVLIVECAPDVPRNVRGDAVKLRQVLINLISNAIKFTPAGSVALRIKRCAPEYGDRLSFEVRDTGVGIGRNELDQVGKLFVQAQAGRKSREGTGLGLMISRNFVQLMGGELKIWSEEGVGTALSFDLAMQVASAEALVDQSAARESRVIGLAPGQATYRILVVDDRADARQLLVRLLTGLGIEVREACDGEEAVSQSQQWAPHLVFMDMRMPIMDGHEATRRIKALPSGRHTMIVALTASGFESDRAQMLEEGCDAFLSKPFQEPALFELMSRLLGMRFIYDTAQTPGKEEFDKLRYAALPAALHMRLRAAVIDMNIETIEAAIAEIRQHDGGVAADLEALAENFNYERILALIGKSEDLPA